jgi:hypothetical protein
MASARVEGLRQRATQCDGLAAEAHDRVLRGIYEDLVEQWLNLAEQVEQLEAERVE